LATIHTVSLLHGGVVDGSRQTSHNETKHNTIWAEETDQ